MRAVGSCDGGLSGCCSTFMLLLSCIMHSGGGPGGEPRGREL